MSAEFGDELFHSRLILAPKNLSTLKAEDPKSDTGVGEIASLCGDLGALLLTHIRANITAIKKVRDALGHGPESTGECRARNDGGSVIRSWRSMTY